MHFFWRKSAFFRLRAVYISISYFSHKYFTTLGGKSLVVGWMPLASKKARSVFSQRRKVSGLTPAARASSIFVRDFISISHYYQLLYTSFFVYACFSVVPCGSVVKHHPFFSFSRRDTEGMPNKQLTQLCTFRGRHSHRWFGVCLCGSSTSSYKWWLILGRGGPSMSQSRCEQIEFDSGS